MTFDQFISDHFMLLVIAALWSLPWKGVALWKAASQKQMGWFVALLVLNTFAILEITYLFYFSKTDKKDEPEPK